MSAQLAKVARRKIIISISETNKKLFFIVSAEETPEYACFYCDVWRRKNNK